MNDENVMDEFRS